VLSLAEQAQDHHGDEDAFDDEADNRLGGGELRLQSVEVEFVNDDAPVDGVEADLKSVGSLLDGWDRADENGGRQQERGAVEEGDGIDRKGDLS
jgi:hypothetical protein